MIKCASLHTGQKYTFFKIVGGGFFLYLTRGSCKQQSFSHTKQNYVIFQEGKIALFTKANITKGHPLYTKCSSLVYTNKYGPY